MKFKIGSVSVFVSFTFFAAALFFTVVGRGELLAVTYLCALLHEAGHMAAILLFGGRLQEIRLTLAGAEIRRREPSGLSRGREALVCLAGPAVNLALALGSLFACGDGRFSQVNFLLCGFNALPFYSLDGGRVIEVLLAARFSRRTVCIVGDVLSLAAIALLGAVSVAVFVREGRASPFWIVTVYLLSVFLMKKRSCS